MNPAQKTDGEWRAALTPEQYAVCRQKGTEAPFAGELLNEKRPGTFACVCCGAALFDSAAKFDSGTGWPSFERPASASAVAELADDSVGMRRVEALCAACGAHLGHVFPDGPTATGLRYCINSVALRFAPEPA